LTLLETFQFLKSCHRRAPFLFFNGNTFAEIGRALATALFSNLPFQRRKEASSAVAHFITGVLEQEMMVGAIETLSQTADWKTGDRVKTLRGSLHGMIVRVLKDGRVVWRPDGTKSELTALPESLCADK
jgi:Fe2+ transport system protein B